MLNTHMPFFAEHKGEAIELCCRKVNNFWKIHRKIDGEWRQADTEREYDAIECGPTAEWIDGDWKISFIAGAAEGNRLFKLYSKHKGQVRSEESPGAFGFVRSDITVFGNLPDIFKIKNHNSGNTTELRIPGMNELLRISYDPSNQERLLISGRYHGALSSWIYDWKTKELFDLKADGIVAYKCAFRHDKCYYAKQIGAGFEDREIVEAENIQLTPVGKSFIETIT